MNAQTAAHNTIQTA